jgi:septal ring factor EnvC (AmiA/AmiB activator)
LAHGALCVLTGALIVFALALGAASSGAQDIGALNAKIDGARAQAQGLAAEIDSASAELAATQSRALAAAAHEAELSATLARGEEREARLEAEARAAGARLEAARARLGRALDTLATRLVEIYKNGTTDPAVILLEAEGFDDLTTRMEYLQRIEAADEGLIVRVRALREQVAAQLVALERAEAEAAAFNEQVAAARDQIASVRAAAEAQATALAEARSRRQAALESLQGQVGEWSAEVQRLERISAREADEEVSEWFGDWAIPESIVQCESGGNWDAVNPSSGAGGAYQILPSTWELYGGEGNPEDASPAQQSEIASQIWADSGSAAWVCAG